MESTPTPGQGGPWQPAPGTRQADILEAVTERGTVRVTDLAQELEVTAVTVRRDVVTLAEAGLVRRIHGGATTIGRSTRMNAGVGNGGRRRNATVGTLVPSLDFYWPDVVRGAEEEMSRMGMRMVLRGSVYHAKDERSDIDRLIDAGSSGLLLAPTVVGAGGENIRQWLAESPIPAVLMERSARVGPIHRTVESVVTDHASGARMAVHHLASLGHERIGVALNKHSPHVDQIRIGWQDACADLELGTSDVADVPLPERYDPSYDETMHSVLDQVVKTDVTALIVHSDPEAVRVMQNAEERGIRVPDELSIISYDDQVAALSTPALSAIRTPRRTIGRTAMGLLAARIADPDRPIHRVQVSPTLVPRASSGPAPS